MPDKEARIHTLAEFLVRFFCGGLIGVFIGFGWWHYFGVDGNPTQNWMIFGGAVALCGLLAARFGDDFWSSILPWM